MLDHPILDQPVLFVAIVLFGGVIYLLPTLIAVKRDHHNVGSIFVINLFLGATFIGWVIALAWSVSQVKKN